MLKRLLLTIALLSAVLAVPQLPTLVLAVGKPVTFALLAPLALLLWVAAVANILERS